MFDFDLGMVNWARAQFALTAMYHWLFVPLTIGISFLCAFFESLYVKTGNEEWKRITKFWMTLFGINFAIGVATGIILEFQFGTNWSNYSWIVGDIFGAPLAIEGIAAFFLEATFFAVMFFGWERVSKKQHLFATWMVAIGSNLSAWWILAANGWMQAPAGMKFNPESVRFEMENFAAVAFSKMAVSKFVHVTASSFIVASLFVVGVSCWFLLKKRHQVFARKSIMVAAVFGLISSLYTAFTGDESAYQVAQKQPMKLAAFEGLYNGEKSAGLVAAGVLDPSKSLEDQNDPFLFKVKIPGLLSLLSNRTPGTFVPGIYDLVYGNEAEGIESVESKMAKGKTALESLKVYKESKISGNLTLAESSLASFNENQKYMGHGHLSSPKDVVPPVGILFYSFHLMVALGSFFILFFAVAILLAYKDKLSSIRPFLWTGVASFFLGIISSEAGWVVAEVGRQPWAIQDMLPVTVAATNIGRGNVQATFFMFLIVFTILLVAEIMIMLKQISIGPQER